MAAASKSSSKYLGKRNISRTVVFSPSCSASTSRGGVNSLSPSSLFSPCFCRSSAFSPAPASSFSSSLFSHFSAKSFASFASALRCFLFMVVVVVFSVGAFSSSFPSSSSSRSFLFVLFFFSGTGRVEGDGVGEDSSSVCFFTFFFFLGLPMTTTTKTTTVNPSLWGEFVFCARREKKRIVMSEKTHRRKEKKIK
jgi:hypothetical protein